MENKVRKRAAEILFDLTATLEPRVIPLRQWFFDTLDLTERWANAEGNQGVKRMKDCLDWAWRHVLGEKPETLSFTQSDKSGCPSVVRPFVKRIMSLSRDVRLMSAAQTLVRLTDLWEGIVETKAVTKSISVIRDTVLPGTAKLEIKRFSEFVPKFFAAYPDHPITKAFQASIHLDQSNGYLYRQTKGPNGALIASAHKDWLTLSKAKLSSGKTLLSEVHDFQDLLSKHCEMSFGTSYDFDEAMVACGVDRLFLQQKPRSTPGKLSNKPEKGGKVRIVAQPDYFTQLSLKPLHKWLEGILRNIPSDYTFDQKGAIPPICKWQTEGTAYTASFDQSACTDRFPFDYQLELIRYRFGEPLMESFKAIVSDRAWEYTLPDGKVRTVRWSVGQPLGMYGSWPLMAVTHHLLVQYCYWLSRGRTFKKGTFFQKYAICGDDIVIGDVAVARQYLILTKRLGMVVNLSKSHESGGKTSIPPISEFAKVTIWRGNPLTPIKPKMVLSAVLDARNAIPLFFDLASSRTWVLRRKFIETRIKKYFPREKNFLTSLLTIPREFGGLGFRDDRSLKRLFGDLKLGEVHPLLYYIADRIRVALKKEQSKLASCESLAESIPAQLFRKHPLMEYLREKNQQIQRLERSLGVEEASTMTIVARLLLNGSEGLTHLWTESESPDYPFVDASKFDRRTATSWTRALSKKHSFCKRNAYSAIPGLEEYLEDPKATVRNRLTQDPDWYAQRQVDVIESFLLAERSAQRTD